MYTYSVGGGDLPGGGASNAALLCFACGGRQHGTGQQVSRSSRASFRTMFRTVESLRARVCQLSMKNYILYTIYYMLYTIYYILYTARGAPDSEVSRATSCQGDVVEWNLR